MNPIRFSAAKVIFHDTPQNTNLRMNQGDRETVIKSYGQIAELLNKAAIKTRLDNMDDSVTIEFFPHGIQPFTLPGGPVPDLMSQIAKISLKSPTENANPKSLLQPLLVERGLRWFFGSYVGPVKAFVNQVLDTAQSLDNIKKLNP